MSIKVKFAELGINDESLINSVTKVLKSGRFISGENCVRFSDVWAKECGAKYSIPVASGSAALIATLRAIKLLGKGKYVIVPSYSFAASVFSIIEAGFIPVYCDILDNGLLDQIKCLELVNSIGYENIAAIMVVHLYGQRLQIIEDLLEFPVIEDACQAHGVIKRVQGIAACFSFYPSKNLGAAGDAGAIVTNNQSIASITRAYINYGDYPGKKYTHSIQGNNLRMDEIQASFLLTKLESNYLKLGNETRAKIASIYESNGLVTFASEFSNSWHLYPLIVDDPKSIADIMLSYGIETGNHYPYTLPDICEGFNQDIDYPNAIKFANHIITLPIGPHMVSNQADYVSDIFNHHMSYNNAQGMFELVKIKLKGTLTYAD